MTRVFLIELVFCKKKKLRFIGVEIEQDTSVPAPKKNPGSAPGNSTELKVSVYSDLSARSLISIMVAGDK